MTLYRILSTEIAAQIEQGVYCPGDRLPGLRTVSRNRNVSMATAVAAYRELESTGIIEARERSGYFVKRRVRPNVPLPSHVMPAQQPVLVKKSDIISRMLSASMHPQLLQLGGAIPDASWLPNAAIKKATVAVVRQHRVDVNRYQFSPGLPLLRQQIVQRLSLAGCTVSPANVLMTSGGHEALWLALKATTSPGDTVAIESPCYYGLLVILESLQLKALEIPTHPAAGLSLDALSSALHQWPVKACVVVPTFSNPLGCTISDENKKALIQLLNDFDVPLIEDDIFAEIPHFGERPKPALYWDQEGRHLLCSSFSKTLSPGLRLGWVFSKKYWKALQREKLAINTSTATLSQYVAAELLSGGAFEKHLKVLKARSREAVAKMKQLILEAFPSGTRVTAPTGGYLLWVELPEGCSAARLAEASLAQGVNIAPGTIFSNSNHYHRHLRLNCSIPDRDMERGIGKLARSVTDSTEIID